MSSTPCSPSPADASPGASSPESPASDDSKTPASGEEKDPATAPPPLEAQPGARRLAFPLVGIGASAGGLEAIEALTHRLSADRMAFVVIQHLAPGHVSLLAEILARGTSLRVVTIAHGMKVEPGTLYVAPPSTQVALDGDELSLESTGAARGSRHTIDSFLRSLARAGGPMAIGVVLSGSGSDGTLGLRAIKDEGGITFAQEPTTASQPNMPQSAIDAGCADFSLTPAEIGDELMRLSAHPYVGHARPVKLVDTNAVSRTFAQLRAAYGVDFALYKPSTIERRIGRRMALHKLERAEDYVALLTSEPNELRALYNDLLIGVTSFFRDAEPFEALKNVVFPRLVENRSTDNPIRIWVAGCASGEEAYSIAISLLEFLGERAQSFKIQVFATDVDEDALARARLAIYPPNVEIDLSPDRLQRFFARTDKGYQVSRQVRDLVVFARHNLGKDPPFSRLDLVTCRNVLIYMQSPLQKKVLRIFHYALNPDAYLLLGTSESVGDAADLFSLLERKLKVYVKKNVPATAAFEFSLAGRPTADDPGTDGKPQDHRPIASIAQIADRKVIERYAPPGVIVDERLEVVQFRGRTGPYLEHAPGAATLNLLKLARPELVVALRTTLHKSFADATPATSPPVPLWTGAHGSGASRAVTLDVMPLTDAGGRKCLLVLFNEAATHAPPRGGDGADVRAPSDDEPRIALLERELAANKESLQSTIEELEAANEELQSANEELQSSNEELQSTNEELETSKEELQSTNEELATVNDELNHRMAQLSVANDDLQNVLMNTTAALLVIGADLRIRRFSAAAEKLLSLIPGDVGRPIAYLRNVVSSRDIETLASDVVTSIVSREQRVRCIDGFWYAMRLFPYVTADHMIRGLVLEFSRTAPPAAADIDDVPPLARQVLSTLPQAAMLIDKQLRLVWANRLFFETFAVDPGMLGRPIADAWGSTSEPPELWAFFEELGSTAGARDVLIEHPFGRTSERPVRFSGKMVPAEVGDRSALGIVFMQEI